MGDDEIIDQPLDSEVEEESVNADEKIPNSDSDQTFSDTVKSCLLYTSDAADE